MSTATAAPDNDDTFTDCDNGKHWPIYAMEDYDPAEDGTAVYCVTCGLEGDDVPHKGHTLRLTGAWYCDTCNSPYCDLL